jgi:putative peptide zinc metalloprotease protein
LKVIGQLIALGSLYGLLIQPLWKVYKFFKIPGRLGKVKRARMYTSLGLLAAAMAAIMLIPLPSRVYCSLEVHPRDAASVYVMAPGILEAVHVKPGQTVEKGDVLAELSNIDLLLGIADLEGQRDVAEAQLASLQLISLKDKSAASQIAPAIKNLDSIEEQLRQQQFDAERLTLVAPVSGTVFPPSLVPDVPTDGRLSTWSGSPFDKENLGALLPKSTKLCEIGNPKNLEARLVIDQNDVTLVHPDQEVEIILNQSAEYKYISYIATKSAEDLKVTPPRLSGLSGGDIPTQMDAAGVARPLKPYYEAVVPLAPHEVLRVGLVGTAKIKTAPRTLWSRVWRYISRTFNFEL